MIESLDEQGAVAGAAKSASYQNCAFVSKGCNWTFGSTTDVEAHLRECKYRPYTCIGTQLGIWKYVAFFVVANFKTKISKNNQLPLFIVAIGRAP